MKKRKLRYKLLLLAFAMGNLSPVIVSATTNETTIATTEKTTTSSTSTTIEEPTTSSETTSTTVEETSTSSKATSTTRVELPSTTTAPSTNSNEESKKNEWSLNPLNLLPDGCVIWIQKVRGPQVGIRVPIIGGNTGAYNLWYYYYQGVQRGSEPAKYALAIWDRNASNPYGHVALVEDVSGDNVTLSEGGVKGSQDNGIPGLSWKTYNKHDPRMFKNRWGLNFLGYIYLKEKPAPPIRRYNVDQLAAQVGQSIADGEYNIVSSVNPVLGFNVENITNGAPVKLMENDTDPKQVFQIKYLGNGFYRIVHKHTNNSLDMYDMGNGATVYTYGQHNLANQQWIIKPIGSDSFEIVSRQSGLVLDIWEAKIAPGTHIRLNEANGGSNQSFKFIPAPKRYDVNQLSKEVGQSIIDGDYRIVSAYNNELGIDVEDINSTNGSNIRVWENTADTNQIFSVKYIGGGYYNLIHKYTNNSLDVYKTGNGATVYTYPQHNLVNQQWIIKPVNSGIFEIVSRRTGLVLDIWGANITQGSEIRLHESNDGNNQKFMFIPEPQTVRLTAPTATMTVGKTMTIKATVTPSNANSTAVTWKSSNPKVATVNNGKVTARSAGHVDIIATTVVGHKTAKFRITVQPNTIPIYRLHHPKTKQYFYTKNLSEVATLKSKQWVYEGKAFLTVTSGKPVFRLYNANRKAYLFTTNVTEKNSIVKKGWKYEGIAWYSAGPKKVYRLFNPKTKIHMYTVHMKEVNLQRSRGWKYEGVTFLTY